MMTLKIELTVAYNSAEKDAVILKLARILAKQLLAQAGMMQDVIPPEISIECGDFYTPTQEVKLFDDDGTEFDVAIVEAVERFDTRNAGLNRIRINARPEETTGVDQDAEGPDERF